MSSTEARVLNLVGEVSGRLDLDEFRDALFSALRHELPCDYVSLNQIAPDPEQNWSITDPPLSERDHTAFYRYALQNPIAAAQARVLRRLAVGSSTADIAGELEIAQRTVHKHLQHIDRRLGVRDRAAAARAAWRACAPETG